MNLKQVRIQNFRNLKDVTVHLNDVNLLIGPNNSGKSNVLHAIRLGSMIIQKNLQRATEINYTPFISSDEYYKWLTSAVSKKNTENFILSFIFDLDETHSIYLSCNTNNIKTKIHWGITDNKFTTSIPSLEEIINEKKVTFIYLEKPHSTFLGENFAYFKSDPIASGTSEIFQDTDFFLFNQTNLIAQSQDVIRKFVNFPIYEISIKEMRVPYGTTGDNYILKNASNIVSFLDFLMTSRNDIYLNLKATLSLITKDFQGIRLDVIYPNSEMQDIRDSFPNSTIKCLGLIDSKSYENTIWAEYLSDGILYFLALLCVVHQPYPPPILLLEEPEKGIHPRRIREVMDLLFALAEEKKIQIILTTHSTFVVDEFTDVPENVTVFDNNEAIITVKNLKNDIIDKINNSLEKNNYSKDYLQNSLGENWALGLLGGIPN